MTRRDLLRAALLAGGASVFPNVLGEGLFMEKDELKLKGNRFLTLNAIVRVNQIEVSRDHSVGSDEGNLHSPEKVKEMREALRKGCPTAKMTWALSWLALQDTRPNYEAIRELLAGYVHDYGDEVTFIPGAFFSPMYNSRQQVNRDLHDGLKMVSDIVGSGYRPKSVVAGFLAAENFRFLAEEEGIHVCQGNIWSQYGIDNGDGDGSVCYPYFPSNQHFLKPAQASSDFIDCVNLDGWTCDFLTARRPGFAEGFNSRLGVGPIETYRNLGPENGLKEVMHTTGVHFDGGFKSNGFGWVTAAWEVSLWNEIAFENLTKWVAASLSRWPKTKIVTQGEFGLAWRRAHRSNNWKYQFDEVGSGLAGSELDKRIRWFMCSEFRLALLGPASGGEAKVIDFTRYDLLAQEPTDATPTKPTRNWSLMNRLNQKGTRPQDKPVLLSSLTDDERAMIAKAFPGLRG